MFALPHLDLPPLRAAAGRVRLPGSKSISNRVLLLAGLAEGVTEIRDLLDSDDTRVMLAALRALGCGLERAGPVLRVKGLGGRLPVREADLFLWRADATFDRGRTWIRDYWTMEAHRISR